MPLRLHSSIPPLRDAVRWVNSSPVDVAKLRGRPVLVHFMSMSCTACKEQLPDVRAWARRYGGRLQLVGVHTPTQPQDADEERVEQAIRELQLSHPVALDNEEGDLADAYQVRFTPSYFLFDRNGELRHFHGGFEAVDPVARAIERVLAETQAGETHAGT
ncbi:MAG: redoxin domain-containing protein [Myxococcaceae bacterium]